MVVSVVVLEFNSYLHLLESIVYRGILIVSKNIFTNLILTFHNSSRFHFLNAQPENQNAYLLVPDTVRK